MKTKLISLILAVLLLAGCAKKTTDHIVVLDELSFTLPHTFTDVSQDSTDTEQAFMYAQDSLYISGFKESKEDLLQYFESISLGAYVQMFNEYYLPEYQAELSDEIWHMSYSSYIEGEKYTFLCVFYETESHFWRVQGCCPTEEFAENRQNLWNYITSVH